MKNNLLQKFSNNVQGLTATLQASEHGIYTDGTNTFIWFKLPEESVENQQLDLLELTW